ncbi:citrate synthase [Cardiosporidium cionae]|uniref:Citrate synthase n=1 Tax=Cardiosporidium cionae TaxID=476202 RepID=A0ABQ7JG21_9APIC|nr:citrate synthase [Cardiosporidium cionae]|eukprot:KAF8822977.1 citrate synthase [Cardiosporidium cionae]
MTAVSNGEKLENMALLTLPDGRELKLKILSPTIGQETILDIRDMKSRAGCITFDPGFNSTASCRSAITYIDGDKGICLYRGYPVVKLVNDQDYLSICYLLLYGEWASASRLAAFTKQIKREMLLHERIRNLFSGFLTGAHPMAILDTVVSALASFYCNPAELSHDAYEERELACVRLIAKMVTIAAMAYKLSVGEPFIYPRSDLTYAENFLHMMFSNPTEPYVINKLHAELINTFLIIHADHEQAASTCTVRTAGSSGASPYACISAGITSLWGRAHGGANEAVIRMLKEIEKVENIPNFIIEVKQKTRRLMGFGHRVYRNHDPRCIIMRDLCMRLFHGNDGYADPLFSLAMELEETALKDEYFVSRKLYPNVDFYSGIALRALGIPETMFTVMFALGRTVGWLSHWKEMVQEPQVKISRPRQLYMGNAELPYAPVRNKWNIISSENNNENSEKHLNDTTQRNSQATENLSGTSIVKTFKLEDKTMESNYPFHVVQAKALKSLPNSTLDYDFDMWGELSSDDHHIHVSEE